MPRRTSSTISRSRRVSCGSEPWSLALLLWLPLPSPSAPGGGAEDRRHRGALEPRLASDPRADGAVQSLGRPALHHESDGAVFECGQRGLTVVPCRQNQYRSAAGRVKERSDSLRHAGTARTQIEIQQNEMRFCKQSRRQRFRAVGALRHHRHSLALQQSSKRRPDHLLIAADDDPCRLQVPCGHLHAFLKQREPALLI